MAPPPLFIRETDGRNTTGGKKVYIQGVSKVQVNSLSDFFEALVIGDRNRITASTNANETSSRSHAVMMVSICSSDSTSTTPVTATEAPPPPPLLKESVLMMVDLAGSER